MTDAKERQEEDIQRLGHQIASFSGVVVVALVEFGVPLSPGQQSAILSIIMTGWALASTVYGLSHRIGSGSAIPQRVDGDDSANDPVVSSGEGQVPAPVPVPDENKQA